MKKKRGGHASPQAMRDLALGRSDDPAALAHVDACRPCSRELALLRRLAGAVTSRGHAGPCPDALLLVRRAAGEDLGASREAVEAHLTECSACASDLEGLVDAGRRRLPVPGRTPQALAEAWGRLTDLVTFDMPASVAVVTRAAVAEPAPRFDGAMEHYRAGRFGQARRGLEAAVRSGEGEPDASFFFGACLLRAGEAAAACERLREAVRRRCRLGEARWLLAQALLAADRGEEALDELVRLARGRGPRREAARRQADALRVRLREG